MKIEPHKLTWKELIETTTLDRFNRLPNSAHLDYIYARIGWKEREMWLDPRLYDLLTDLALVYATNEAIKHISSETPLYIK